jgi:hypothetical protein
MTEPHSICSVCAWRETCKKKFTISGRDVNCSDFTRDITIKPDSSANTEAEKTDGPQKK